MYMKLLFTNKLRNARPSAGVALYFVYSRAKSAILYLNLNISILVNCLI